MSSAQRDIQQIDEHGIETDATPSLFDAVHSPDASALKQQIADKVAAHRARKSKPAGPQLAPAISAAPSKTRSSRIAATVAERYAQSQSYRAFLAEEAEKAIRQAEAAAEIAARNAQAVATAQYELLAELHQYVEQNSAPELVLTSPEAPPQHPKIADPTAPPTSPEPLKTSPRSERSGAEKPALSVSRTGPLYSARTGTETAGQPLRVQLLEDVTLQAPAITPAAVSDLVDESETIALDEEIAFRQSPVFEDPIPPVEIPGNLIQFPRQLIAPRRARPRLAEGPLREETDQSSDSPQLRIFEVESAQISTAPAVEDAAPEWSGILLSPQPAPAMVAMPEEDVFAPHMLPQTAPIGLRLMSAIVDACIVTAATVLFIASFVLTVSHFAPSGAIHTTPQIAGIAAAAIFFTFALAYQALFFTFSDATPGMRYARIGLCTLSDDNPTRAAMRHRIFAHLLSAAPLGMGYLWAFLDDHRLSWHDRVSKMYQRSY